MQIFLHTLYHSTPYAKVPVPHGAPVYRVAYNQGPGRTTYPAEILPQSFYARANDAGDTTEKLKLNTGHLNTRNT